MAKDTTKTAVKNGETDTGTDTRPRAGEAEVTTNKVDLEGTRNVPDERLEKISGKNAVGHEKNMKAIEEAHKDNDGKPDPSLGREDNGNTPRIDKDGNKHWGPPGVAGAVK